MSVFDVVIPAGGTIDADFARRIGSPYRALAPLGSDKVPVLQHVVNTLRGSGAVGRIVCVAPPAVQAAVSGVDHWLPAGDSGPQNILAGLRTLCPDALALVCTSDLPLMTPEAVTRFVSLLTPDAAVAVGMVRANAYNAAFPDAPPSTFVELRDMGPVTLAGLFAVRPAALFQRQALLDSLFGARKSQAWMAGIFGPRLLLAWAMHRLTLSALTARAEALLEATVQVVDHTNPALAYDMDTADDYEYVKTYANAGGVKTPGKAAPSG